MKVKSITINGNTFEISDPAVEQMQAAFNDFETLFNQTKDRIEREVETNTASIGELKTTAQLLNQTKDRIEQDVSTNTDAISELKTTVQLLNQSKERIEQDVVTNANAVANLQTEMSEISEELNTAEKRILQLSTKQEESVSTVPQTLTKEQQAQVVKNIGAVPSYIIYAGTSDENIIFFDTRVDFDEMLAAFQAGAYVAVRLVGQYENHCYNFTMVDYLDYPLVDPAARSAVFLGFDTDEMADQNGIRLLTLYADERYAHMQVYGEEVDITLSEKGIAADAYTVGKKLGDVETALDHILAIQESLMGGA